ncbi:Prolyl 4-hydroxylase subunit alpha-3 [Acropora cervicornis]|uniref:procollagen-proline 4-dioxygenase n=1 Tax=Acropora cervicornis TaxID=6130 RepID=A0AAD9Q7R5_ACRCE|nr:Prolyl 4-hydroxylase subunit alpha-3 [Acropora cervicornis]
MTRFMLLLLWMSQHLSVLQGEIFTSLSQLKGLARLEAALSLSLDNYLKDQSQPPEILRNFADNVRRESEIARGDIENYIFHPINSFQLVRRFVRHWKELDSYLSKGTRNDLQWEIEVNRPAFPTSKDYMGSISALLRIQNVYNLSANAIANGQLHDGNSSGGLGPDECYDLGVVSHGLENYEDVIDWMREALMRMSPPYEYSGALEKGDVLEYLSWAEYQVGRLDEAIVHTKEILDKDPKNERAQNNLNHFEVEQLNLKQPNTDKVAVNSKKMLNNKMGKKESFMLTYERLCRGESRKATDYRTSQSAWLEDSVSPIINRISQRIQAITELSVKWPHAEPLQKPDGSLPSEEIGDRIATVLFYLSNVHAGGSTVFLNMEEFVNPKKGDAVFWYNLDKRGRPDTKTRHAACPVIVGSKWVANKWINERGQEFRRPCPRG